MELTTTDGKLIIDGTIIRQKRLTNTRRRNFILYCYFLFFFVDLTIDKIDIAKETDKTSKWVGVGIYSLILLLYIGIALDFLFRQYLKSKVDISKVDKIKTYTSDEGLETNVILTMKSKRYKRYVFRTLENQYDQLVDRIQSLNSSVQIIKE
ncbi:MAG: hypothetical protein E6Q39_02115 [Crocinitomicaceae bacterium]|nr:MAG: hypothetical protein E6Q39_02115 [Crocinitomicaceae bacterium]